MDIEHRLVSRCVLSGTIEQLVSRGISHTHFERLPTGDESEHAKVFKTMVSFMRTYNAPPSRDAVLMVHPTYRLEAVEDALDFLIDEFIKKVKRRETQKAILDVASRIDDRDEQMELEMVLFEAAEHVAQIVPSSRVSKISQAPSRLELYREYLRNGKPAGVPLGYPTLDRICLGVQKFELVTIAAFSNWGKSTIMQTICLMAYLSDEQQRPLFISLEMEADALLRRFDAMAMKIRANAIKGLEIAETSEDMRKWERWAERASKAPNDILIVDDIHHCTIERVLAENMRYKPTCCFTDYVQLMEGPGDNSYLKVGNAIKGLKRIARMTHIPQFTAAQTTRSGAKDGVKEDNIADSIEIFRSSDILIGLERTEELDEHRQAILKLVKARDSQKGHCTINFDWDTMDFSEYSGFERRTDLAPVQGSTELAPPEDDMPSSALPEPEVLNNPFYLAQAA